MARYWSRLFSLAIWAQSLLLTVFGMTIFVIGGALDHENLVPFRRLPRLKHGLLPREPKALDILSLEMMNGRYRKAEARTLCFPGHSFLLLSVLIGGLFTVQAQQCYQFVANSDNSSTPGPVTLTINITNIPVPVPGYDSPNPTIQTGAWWNFLSVPGNTAVLSFGNETVSLSQGATQFYLTIDDSSQANSLFDLFIVSPNGATSVELTGPSFLFPLQTLPILGSPTSYSGTAIGAVVNGVTVLSVFQPVKSLNNNCAANSPPPNPPVLVNPVPDLLDGPQITTRGTDDGSAVPYLADLTKGRIVQGVATDGVAQVVIRIPARSLGERFTLAIEPDQCQNTELTMSQCIDQYGLVFDPTFPPESIFAAEAMETPTISAVSTSAGPMAFAAYRAPVDFVRTGNLNGADMEAAARSVHISITSVQNGAQPDLLINLVRPPVVFIHGIASNSGTWSYFEPLISDARFSNCYVDYGPTNLASLSVNAPIAGRQLTNCVSSFARSYAAVQADAVVHSMGGLLVRTFSNSPNFASFNNYERGPIHKLITIGTPHLGTPLATALQVAPLLCAAESTPFIVSFAIGGGVLAVDTIDKIGGLKDLATNSPAIRAISMPNPHRIAPLIRAHVIVGVASNDQEVTNAASVTTAFLGFCPALTGLLKNGFHAFYGGPNDNAVPSASQQALGLGFGDPAAFGPSSPSIEGDLATVTTIPGVIHSVIPTYLPMGPDELSKTIDASGRVVAATASISCTPATSSIPCVVTDLLNSPISGNSFAGIVP